MPYTKSGRWRNPKAECKNKFRHKWVDWGKFNGKREDSYTYFCKHCKRNRIKVDSFSMAYYTEDWIYTGGHAPECIER